MDLDTLIPLWMKHNATIIEALIGTSLLVTAFLSIRSFMEAKSGPSAGVGSPSAGAPSIDLAQLEKSLKQIIEKAGQIPSIAAATSGTAAHASGGNSEDGAKLLLEITTLKSELQNRQRQIEDLKSAPPPTAAVTTAPSVVSSEEKAALNNQVQELQAKLAEYEIISEDIADLSFYKEQNLKLQKELESFKGGAPAGVSVSPISPPPASVQPTTPRAEPAIVGKALASEVVKEIIPESPSVAPSIPEAPAVIAAAAEPAIEPAPTLAAEPAPVGLDTGAAVNTSVDDDLMAEFAAAVEKQKAESAQSGGANLGQLDMDKMINEAVNIQTNLPDIDATKALGTELDENKLMKEADALNFISGEDKNLMGQFENFVKKSE